MPFQFFKQALGSALTLLPAYLPSQHFPSQSPIGIRIDHPVAQVQNDYLSQGNNSVAGARTAAIRPSNKSRRIVSAETNSDGNVNKGNTTSSGQRPTKVDHITLETLRLYFRVPIAKAAEALGISISLLKIVCRRFNISKWPWRKIQAMINQLEPLEIVLNRDDLTDAERFHVTNQVKVLKDGIDAILVVSNHRECMF